MSVHPAIFLFSGIIASYLPIGYGKKLLGLLAGGLCLLAILLRPETFTSTVSYLTFELTWLEIDPVNNAYALIFAIFGFLALCFSYKYVDARLFRRFLFYVASTIMLVHAGDFLTFYLSWELMSISAFFVISYGVSSRARRAGVYYFLFHVTGGVSLLFGIFLQYQGTGSLAVQMVSYGQPFFVYAVLVKVAALGLHFWLPRAYTAAPFTASVFMASITTKAGVYALYRLLEINLLAYVGVAMALGGVLLALKQSRMRRLLSYHVISQVGYMVTGVAAGTTVSILGGNMHVINHILYKGLLFMVAGVVINVTGGRENLARMGRPLGRQIPLTAITGVIASLAIAGVPPFNGFVSKMVIKSGVESTVIEYGLLLAGVGTMLSFLKFGYYGFFAPRDENIELENSVPWLAKFAMAASAFLIVLLGVNLNVYDLFLETNGLIPEVYSFSYLFDGLQPPILAVILFLVLHKYFTPHAPDHVKLHDPFIIIFNKFRRAATAISKLHTGRVPRYMNWLIAGIIIYLALIIII